MDDINNLSVLYFVFINFIDVKNNNCIFSLFRMQPLTPGPGFTLHYVHIYENVEINFPSPKVRIKQLRATCISV